jgi:hypothetical protein
MSRTTNRRITAAALLAGAVLLAALAARPPWASAQSGEAGEVLASGDDVIQCEPAGAPSPDAEIVALMQQDLLAAQQRPRGPSEGSDVVVLNNRGYNYGPPPGVRFDALLPGRGPNASESAR